MTTPLFTKLNYKGQAPLVVLGAPESFAAELAALGAPALGELSGPFGMLLAFVTRLAEVEAATAGVAAHSTGDELVWLAYPKASSRRYRCEFNRDTGWASLGALGYEPVRQVAIDDDWSALRFRRVAFISRLTRDPRRRIS